MTASIVLSYDMNAHSKEANKKAGKCFWLTLREKKNNYEQGDTEKQVQWLIAWMNRLWLQVKWKMRGRETVDEELHRQFHRRWQGSKYDLTNTCASSSRCEDTSRALSHVSSTRIHPARAVRQQVITR